MPKRKKSPRKPPSLNRFPAIEAAASEREKAELVDLLVEVARAFPEACRFIEASLEVDKPVDLLLADVESAIVRATDFDERMLNRNFDYDDASYREVWKGFENLLDQGHLGEVKQLALRLMERGSRQVEASDEGMMTDDIEACLTPVIKAVATTDRSRAKSWAARMISADRVGFILDSAIGCWRFAIGFSKSTDCMSIEGSPSK